MALQREVHEEFADSLEQQADAEEYEVFSNYFPQCCEELGINSDQGSPSRTCCGVVLDPMLAHFATHC